MDKLQTRTFESCSEEVGLLMNSQKSKGLNVNTLNTPPHRASTATKAICYPCREATPDFNQRRRFEDAMSNGGSRIPHLKNCCLIVLCCSVCILKYLNCCFCIPLEPITGKHISMEAALVSGKGQWYCTMAMI